MSKSKLNQLFADLDKSVRADLLNDEEKEMAQQFKEYLDNFKSLLLEADIDNRLFIEHLKTIECEFDTPCMVFYQDDNGVNQDFFEVYWKDGPWSLLLSTDNGRQLPCNDGDKYVVHIKRKKVQRRTSENSKPESIKINFKTDYVVSKVETLFDLLDYLCEYALDDPFYGMEFLGDEFGGEDV